MKATGFNTIAKGAACNKFAQDFPAAKPGSEPACNPQRSAYQGETLLSANRSVSCDTWRSGLNNNVLVLGSSGGGKTRNHVKPNLLQCQGSYIVLDCKGSLYHEMGPYLEENGYIVDCIDFNAMDGTIGYNPLDHIRWCEGRPMQQDIISIASAICPVDEHASILGILAADLVPFGFEGVIRSYSNPRQIDFCSFGREKRALFVTIDDMDRSLDKLTSLFIQQAFSSLCRSADRDYPNHRLPVPVRFVLDDFANLRLPHIDDVLSVIRSREISCTVVCQTISQLEARYGEATANSIVGNCDSQLVLGFQDERTATYFSCRANKTASTLLETPAGMWWVFLRGQRGAMDPARRLEDHPRYPELIGAKRAKEARIELEEQRRREEGDRMLREIEEELNVSFEELEMEDFDERNIA